MTTEQERAASPETLFFHNLRFALRLAGADDSPNLDERRAAALRALWKAAQTYRARPGPIRFVHYAYFGIRRSITEARAEAFPGIRVPARAREMLRRLRDGLPLTATQRKNISCLVPVYLDSLLLERLDADVPRRFEEAIQDTAPGPLENLLSLEDSSMVRRWMEKSLDEREVLVLTRLFGLDGNPPENRKRLAKKLRVCRQRVEQIEKKALRKLREFKRLQIAW